MHVSSASGSNAPVGATASTTAEMLAALPEALMLPDGAPAAERKLTDVLALYRAIFLNSTEPIVVIDAAGRYLEQNPAHELNLGYGIDELRGNTPAIHLGEEQFALFFAELQQVGQLHREVKSRAKDGRARVVDMSAFAVSDRSGKRACYVAIEHDVTEMRHASEELEKRFAQLQMLYRMSEELGRARALEDIYHEAIDGLLHAIHADRASILLFDKDGVLRFKAWRGLSDEYRAAVEGHSPWTRDTQKPLAVTVADVDADSSLAALVPVIKAEGIRSLAFFPLCDESGLLGKFMLYCGQRHNWSEAEVQLAQTIAQHVAFAIGRHRRESLLREANRAKSAFLAMMSHELRTPLNAIAGYTDLLDAGVHGPMIGAQLDALQRIQANQRHLLKLIDDVLDFAKLEAGHLQLEIANAPVQETVDGTRALIEPQLRAKDITLRFVTGDPLVTCRADRAKMQQVLLNLLANASKFTPQGGTISLAWEATTHHVLVHVQDSGPGVPAEHRETIFEPFVQLQTGFRRRAEGTGLGLAISRELARGMGGEVSVASIVGEGSKFTLILPR